MSGLFDDTVEVVNGIRVVVVGNVDIVVELGGLKELTLEILTDELDELGIEDTVRLLSHAFTLSADGNFLLFMLSLLTTSFNFLEVVSTLLSNPVLLLPFSTEVLILLLSRELLGKMVLSRAFADSNSPLSYLSLTK
jgi:hypothetical protein